MSTNSSGFYKKNEDLSTLYYAPSFVSTPNYELEVSLKDTYTYPVDGWYWFETLSEAMSQLLINPVVNYEEMTNEQKLQVITEEVQKHLDETARQRNYDNILSACNYVTSTDLIFAAEGQACVEFRDATWRKCYQILEEVQQGQRAIPTAPEVLYELPGIEWP